MHLYARNGPRLTLWLLAIALCAASFATSAQYNFILLVDQESTGINPVINPHVSGRELAFTGSTPAEVYKIGSSGIPISIVKPGDEIPGASGGTFRNANLLSFSGDTYAWAGTDEDFRSGNYIQSSGDRAALAGNGSNLDLPSGVVAVDGDNAVWVIGPDREVYAIRGGQQSKIADTSTGVPEGMPDETFRNFFLIDISGGIIVFTASGNRGSHGIYYDMGDEAGLQKLVDTTDNAPGGNAPSRFTGLGGAGPVIDGKTIDTVTGSFEMRDGDTLAIGVKFKGGALAIYWTGPPPVDINAGHSGAWFNPLTSGQGQFIDVFPEEQFMFISWFTFTDAASASPFEQHWFTAQGNYSGHTANLALFETLGGKFDDPKEVSTTLVGEVTLGFNDCENGQMAYRFDEEGLQGAFPLHRVIPGSGNVCVKTRR
jgi:hypothetical protein